MADKSFRCRLITPAAELMDEDVRYVSAPLWDGLAGFKAGRAPFVAKLGMGELRVDFPEGGSRSYLLEAGFGHMVGDTLTLLAQRADPAEQLSVLEAQAELAEANARTSDDVEAMDTITHERARAAMKIRLAQASGAAGI